MAKTKILLAEDEEMISMAFHYGLTYLGYDVTVAVDGLETLAKLDEITPDILLLDMIMPNMNGLETLEALRQKPAYKQLPVIMLTNLSQPSDMTTAYELGATDYLIKSDITLDELVKRVEEILVRA